MKPTTVINNYTPNFISRLAHTKKLMAKLNTRNKSILDLGPANDLSNELYWDGHIITNTGTIDLDKEYETLWEKSKDYDITTAFEIIEHLRNPYMVLKGLQTKYLVLSVPLNVWFAKPYWNDNDIYDTHYHEFYPKQLYSLLDATGWLVTHSEKWKWTQTVWKPRPLLRKFGPWHSWIAVIAKKSKAL